MCAHTDAHTCTGTDTCAHTCIDAHTRVHTHVHRCTSAQCTCTQRHTDIHTVAHACTDAHTHTCTHMPALTYTQRHTVAPVLGQVEGCSLRSGGPQGRSDPPWGSGRPVPLTSPGCVGSTMCRRVISKVMRTHGSSSALGADRLRRGYRSCPALPAAPPFPVAAGAGGAERDWDWSLPTRTGPFPHLLRPLAQHVSGRVFLRPPCAGAPTGGSLRPPGSAWSFPCRRTSL